MVILEHILYSQEPNARKIVENSVVKNVEDLRKFWFTYSIFRWEQMTWGYLHLLFPTVAQWELEDEVLTLKQFLDKHLWCKIKNSILLLTFYDGKRIRTSWDKLNFNKTCITYALQKRYLRNYDITILLEDKRLITLSIPINGTFKNYSNSSLWFTLLSRSLFFQNMSEYDECGVFTKINKFIPEKNLWIKIKS